MPANVQRITLEYGGTGGAIPAGFDVTRAMMMNSICTASNIGANVITYGLFQGFRIVRVDVWGMPSATIPSTVSLEFLGTTGSGRQFSNTSLGATFAPKIRCYPPRGSSAAMWSDLSAVIANLAGTGFGEGGEILYNSRFDVPGAVYQVVVDAIKNDTPGAPNLTSSVSATAVTEGLIYYPAINFNGQLGALNLTTRGYFNPLPAL
jgi:hypothetical protein